MTSQGKQIQMAMTSRTTGVEVSRDDVSSMSERVESVQTGCITPLERVSSYT